MKGEDGENNDDVEKTESSEIVWERPLFANVCTVARTKILFIYGNLLTDKWTESQGLEEPIGIVCYKAKEKEL